MNAWSNIEITDQDPEINGLDRLEINLGTIPPLIKRIRELITRFEVCHFKYQKHLKYIHDSITTLDLPVDPDKIGINHIRQGENAWINDKTGRSLAGQQYLWSLNNWLGKTSQRKSTENIDSKLESKISKWLGNKTSDKERLVKLLIARLTYDWESYEKLQVGGLFKELEYQACRMDICHYSFPDHLDTLIQAIGKMHHSKNFAGCGSYDTEIKMVIKRKYSEVVFKSGEILNGKRFADINHNDQFRIWLFLCLAKTIKELAILPVLIPIPDINNLSDNYTNNI